LRMHSLVMLAGIAAAMAAIAGTPSEWIPARWHSHDPATLELLDDSPVNCLLLEPADQDRRFSGAAAKRGAVVLAVVHPGPMAEDQLGRAASFGMNGLVLEGDFEAPVLARLRTAAAHAGLLVVELPSRARIRLDSGDSIVGTSQGLWPGLEIEHNGKTIAGPTSAPWIYTNGGFLRFLKARTGATVWLGVQPPKGTVFPVERYIQAIGDTAIPGAHWVLALDPDFEKRLYAGETEARKGWKRIAAHLRFYQQWRHAANFGRFGVVMDRDTGGLLSGFLLDLLAAQRTSATVIPPGRVSAKALRGVSILLDLESESLSEQERKSLADFIAGGGMVLEPPKSVQFPPPDENQVVPDRRDLDRLQGLWEMVYNATLRKNFGVRAFNTVGVLTGVTTPDRGRSVLVHLLNFTDYSGEAITVHALGTWKHARMYQPEGPSVDLTVYPVKEGTAVDVDRFATAIAIQFE
jgi:hypothetical protein